VTDISPRVVIKFPKAYRKADCQGEVHRIPAVKLIDQLQRMTAGQIQEVEARRCEAILENWAGQLAGHRGPSQAAAFLCALAGRLNGEVES
jgi:hypothetical protein